MRFSFYMLELAFKNLSRRLNRTLSTALVLSVSMAVYIGMDSLLAGVDKESSDNLINLETGHLKIFHPKYFEEKELKSLDYILQEPDSIIRKLARPEVTGITKRISFIGQLSNGVNQIPIEGYGIDPLTDEAVFSLKKDVEGEYFKDSSSAQAILGKLLARDLNVKIGDVVTVMTREKGGKTISAFDLTVIGLLSSPNPGLNRMAVIVPLEFLQEQLNMGEAVTEIVLRLEKQDKADSFVHKLKQDKRLSYYDIKPWEELGADFLLINQTKKKFSNVLIAVLLIISCLGVTNTLLLSILERIRELGMLLAMGLLPRQIVSLIMLEGIILGLLGSFLGMILGTGFVFYLVKYGITIRVDDKLFDPSTVGYPMGTSYHGAWNLEAFVIVFFVGVVFSTISSLYPAMKASKLQPVEALHYV
jgi:putative ABC transport system permease protein